MKDINGGFPSDSHPYTDDYDYLSDSDLEDGHSCSEEEEEEEGLPEDDGSQLPSSLQDSESQMPLTPPSEDLPRPAADVIEVQNYDKSPQCPLGRPLSPAGSHRRPDNHLTRMGKVAIIRDMGAVTYVRSIAE